MDFSDKIRSPNSSRSDSQRKNSKTIMKISHESNENNFSPNKISPSVTHRSKTESRNSKSPFTSPLPQRRILMEKNDLSNSFKKPSPQMKTDKPVPCSTNGSRPNSPYPLPYDPVTNYTSPRPEFLRYDPNRRMEIMLRIEKAMVDEEEGISPCTSSISTSLQVSAEKGIQEEEHSPSISSISTGPQVQVLVCEAEKCLTDGEEEEGGISFTKLAFKLVFFLVCLVSSVYCICFMTSNAEVKLHARESEVNAEVIGLSKMCSSRRNPELTCGIEEWVVEMEEAKPKEFDVTGLTSEGDGMFTGGELEVDVAGFTPEVEEMLSGGIMDVRKETDGIETDIGLLAQGNIVESPEVELPAAGDEEILERSVALKMQVYLLYSMQALACLSILIASIAYLHKHTSKQFYRKKKQNRASETDVQRVSGAVKKSTDKMSANIVGNSKMYAIQTSEVEFLCESSLTNSIMVNGSSVELQAMNVVDASVVKGSLKEVELQATPTAPTTPVASLEKIEKSKNQSETTKAIVTPLRRSSRLRSRLTPP